MKTHSVFFTSDMLRRAQANVERYPWAAELRRQVVDKAQPWLKLSDEELWNLMFGSTITRALMVWSNGHCPACKQSVPMYEWKIDAWARPWKVACPHCKQLFPTNDFHAFYRSGLDEHGVFDPQRADRALLFNVEHPDPADPLHTFGVDGGEGYIEGDKRWLFIGAYLIYGQWQQLIYPGACNLAAAYVVTRDPVYAHKAGVLLDRIADLFPTHDFGEQGIVYEVKGLAGYVSTWYMSCVETRDLAIAYDQVFEALREDRELVEFLSAQARRYRLDNPKASFADIQRNIEDRILRDPIENYREKGIYAKIYSNYPRTDYTIAVIHTVLDWPRNREQVHAMLDAILDRATAVDGVTGEKGLSAYGALAVRATASLVEEYARMAPEFLPQALQRHPRLHDLLRFHLDTWCLWKYYPSCGDAGGLVRPSGGYMQGSFFPRSPGLGPSTYTLMWRMWKLTGDDALVQLAYRENGHSVADLPHDLFAEDAETVQREIAETIARVGEVPKLGSVNKQEWHLAILRSGQGADERALWLDYDSGDRSPGDFHSHADGLNLGLFARGLDLLPDLGYPPVQFGGWEAPRGVWYSMTAAHNTVVVDGENLRRGAGRTTLWADGETFRVIRASAPDLVDGPQAAAEHPQFERTAALIDISASEFYVVDVFRVIGGSDHAKFTYSHYGQLSAPGLSLEPAPDFGHDTQTRSFMVDPKPAVGWSADWKIEDRLELLPPGSDMHFRCTDLSGDVQAATAQAWIATGYYGPDAETWIPLLMVRRQACPLAGGERAAGLPAFGGRASLAALASTFVTVLEPYEKTSSIIGIRRLPLRSESGARFPDANAAVEVKLADGRSDLLVAADVEGPLGLSPSRARGDVLIQPRWRLRLDGELAWVRRSKSGRVQHVALCRGKAISVGDVAVTLKGDSEFIEVAFHRGRAALTAGSPDVVEAITIAGRDAWKRP